MKKLSFLVYAIFLIVFAQAQENPYGKTLPNDPNMRIGTLENGMTYYIMKNKKPEGMANFYILHNVGAIEEADNQQGLAHFLEHLAFNGLDNLPGNQMREYLQSIGVMFGRNLNAGTGQESTMYMITDVPMLRQGIIDTALLVLHDWSHYISLKPEAIDKERGIIIEELRTTSSYASDRMEKLTYPVLFNHSKYADRNVIGTEKVLSSFSHQQLIDFYHTWYRPDLQAIVVVGDIDPDAIEKQVKELLGSIPARQNPVPKEKILIPDNTQDMAVVASDPEQSGNDITIIIPVEKIPKEYQNTTFAFRQGIIKQLIGAMANERLGDMAKQENAPFTNARLFVTGLTRNNDVLFGRISAKNGKIAAATEAVSTEMERIRKYGFTASEFERAKTNTLKMAQTQYENRNDRKNDQLSSLVFGNFYANSPILDPQVQYQLYNQILETLTLDDINRAIRAYYPDKPARIVVEATQSEQNPLPSADDMIAAYHRGKDAKIDPKEEKAIPTSLISKEPRPGKIVRTSEDTFGNIVWELGNGAKVVVKKTNFKKDEVLMSAYAMGGQSNVDDRLVAASRMFSSFMNQFGAGEFSNTELPKVLAGKQVSAYFRFEHFTYGITGNSSSKDVKTMLQLAYLRFMQPRYDASEFNTIKKTTENNLLNRQNLPAAVFNDSVLNTFYGHSPRRSNPNLEMLKTVELENLKEIHQKVFDGVGGMTFNFVGNMDVDSLKQWVELYIASLPEGKPKVSHDNVTSPQGRIDNIFTRKQEEANKASVYMLFNGDAEFNLSNSVTMSALSHILRLRYTDEIREKRSASYGVGVNGNINIVPVPKYSLTVGFDTNGEMALELTEVVRDEIRKIAENGPREDDMQKMREFFLKDFKNQLVENSAWNSWIESYYRFGLNQPDDFLATMEKMTPKDIQALARKILDDENMIRVIMLSEK